MRSEPRLVKSGWVVGIVCPWANEHSGESNRDTRGVLHSWIGFGFKCFHSHCAEKELASPEGGDGGKKSLPAKVLR